LSESGCPGFEDVQDVFSYSSTFLEVAFCLNQDVQDLRIYRMVFSYSSTFSEVAFCLNQNVQDLRMYRMVF
jgi:hypothetical protein